MPMYNYLCPGCNLEFERIVPVSERSGQFCPKCSTESPKLMAESFAVATKVDASRGGLNSEKEIDKALGEQAENRWTEIEANRRERWKEGNYGKADKVIAEKGENFNPLSKLGAKDRKALGNKYSEGLQAHRAERESKGQGQFTDDTSNMRRI